MPPQIPPAIIEYVKAQDYLPDNVKNIENLSEFINECNETYNGYKIYRLGVIDKINNNYVGYNYKNCYLLLSNKNETRCATESEENDIIYHFPNLTKRFTANIPLEVVKFARFYGETPKEYKPGELGKLEEIKYITPNIGYFQNKPIIRKGYAAYFLAFPYVYLYTKDRCQIVLHNKKETRCATEDEHMEIMVFGANTPKYPAAVANYLESSDWFKNKIKNYDSKNGNIKIYNSLKKNKKYNEYYVYYACFMKPITKENIKSDDCIIILNNTQETRFATEQESYELNSKFGHYHL